MRHHAGVAILLALVCAALVAGHPPDADGHHHEHESTGDHVRSRLWTNARTGEAVHGAFLAARTVDGQTLVSIERANGDVVVFALADLTAPDQSEARRRIDEIAAVNARIPGVAGPPLQAGGKPIQPSGVAPPSPGAAGRPAQAAPFEVFAPAVATRWDDRWLYVESDGLPHAPGTAREAFVFSHPLMVGITAWQQQVPLPQAYVGANAWRIPLRPELAETPISARDDLFRGAIALAANGVPIFNPIKNDGRTDTFLAGELDEFGGHCGRADDYHYHVAPTHLQTFLGEDVPIAYALDGFPIFGSFDPGATPNGPRASLCCPLGGTQPLDELNGHEGAPPAGAPPGTRGPYHYHASAAYPYVNGGMRGVVSVKEGQIDPQPRAAPVRDWLRPLPGARIVGFESTGPAAWCLRYQVKGRPGLVNYRIEGSPISAAGPAATYVFEFVDPDGSMRSATHSAAPPERGGRGGRPGGDAAPDGRPGPRGDDSRAAPKGDPPAEQGAAAAGSMSASPTSFALTSADVTQGRLSVECTCDGASRSPALAWSEPPGDPSATKAFAIVMHHVPREGGAHVYMVVANLPGTARELRSGDTGTGTWGQNTVDRTSRYAPPCSKGPGDKAYTISLYALSAPAQLEPGTPLTRDALLAAIKGSTLATAALEVTYARKAAGDGRGAPQEHEGKGR